MAREWNAEAYHRLSEPQYAWGQRVLERVSARGDETVIDAGCGTARLTVELAAKVPRGRVLAVDLSQNMLRRAREVVSAAKVRNIELVCADSAALPFREVAEGVFSTASFHWVPDHDALFRSLFIALKPGGWLIAQCGGGPNLLAMRQRAEALMKSEEFWRFFEGWKLVQNYQTDKETADRLRRTGFRDIATWLHQQDVTFPDAKTYREFLETVTLHADLERITDPVLRDRFLDLMTAQALQDPQLGLDYWRLNIYARKPD